jgi:hypothetical protein
MKMAILGIAMFIATIWGTAYLLGLVTCKSWMHFPLFMTGFLVCLASVFVFAHGFMSLGGKE